MKLFFIILYYYINIFYKFKLLKISIYKINFINKISFENNVIKINEN